MNKKTCQVWRHTIVSVVGNLRQKEWKVDISLGSLVSFYLKIKYKELKT